MYTRHDHGKRPGRNSSRDKRFLKKYDNNIDLKIIICFDNGKEIIKHVINARKQFNIFFFKLILRLSKRSFVKFKWVTTPSRVHGQYLIFFL